MDPIVYTPTDQFVTACLYGRWDQARHLASFVYVVDIHAENDYAFQCACAQGKLEMAKWLVSLGGVDIHACHDAAFIGSCINGFRETAKWLLSFGGVNIHYNNDIAFRHACRYGHLELGRWLLSLDTEWSKWPRDSMETLKVWSTTRDAWIRAVVVQ